MFWGYMLTTGMLIFLTCVIPFGSLSILLITAALHVTLGFHIYNSIYGCRRFGRKGFIVGMIFVPDVFLAILAFSDVKYNLYNS